MQVARSSASPHGPDVGLKSNRELQSCKQVSSLSCLWAGRSRRVGRQGTDLGREAGHGGRRDPVLRADAPGAVVGRAGRGARGAAAG